MCKEVEKILNEGINKDVATCVVVMDGKEQASDDFVAVLSREDGNASILYNTDALTLGMAMKMIARAFVDSMKQLTEEEREMVNSALGEDFSLASEEA